MDYELHEGDCVTEMKRLPDTSVDLIATDPPYFRVKDDAWDNAWDSRDKFLQWLGVVADEWKRILKPNGSLYVFASPQMAWHVEGVIRERFNVLNNISWVKHDGSGYGTGGHSKVEKESLRAFFPQTEQIIFAEHGGSDDVADAIAGFTEAETQLKKRIFGDYLRDEFKRAGVNNHQVTGAIGAYREHNHVGAASNWLLGLNVPTPEQYAAIRQYLNSANCRTDYLRKEYEDLRKEYEDLRRPFFASSDVPFTNSWTFATVKTQAGKHPCEKPLALMEHIVSLSSRPGATVLDCFLGSGTTGHACIKLGRKFIGIDSDAHWVRYSERRLRDAQRQAQRLPKLIKGHESDIQGLPMFEAYT